MQRTFVAQNILFPLSMDISAFLVEHSLDDPTETLRSVSLTQMRPLRQLLQIQSGDSFLGIERTSVRRYGGTVYAYDTSALPTIWDASFTVLSTTLLGPLSTSTTGSADLPPVGVQRCGRLGVVFLVDHQRD